MKLTDGYEERLTTFTNWPHTIPTAEEMAAAGWVYKPIHKPVPLPQPVVSDATICRECRAVGYRWNSELRDSPIEEHDFQAINCPFASELKAKKTHELEKKAIEQARRAIETQKALRLKEEARMAAAETLEASKPKASANDIGFFDPTMQADLPELHLYATSASFFNHMSTLPDFQEKGVLDLLAKCLRGPAFTWYKDHAFTSLNSFKKALAKAFPPQESEVRSPILAPASAPPSHSPPQYHNCPECSAAFSSLSRLLAHTQKACSKIACKQCEETFVSNNKLHEHVRARHQKPATPSTPKPSRLPVPVTKQVSLTSFTISTSTPSPPQTPIEEPRKTYMTTDDLFAKFAAKTPKTA